MNELFLLFSALDFYCLYGCISRFPQKKDTDDRGRRRTKNPSGRHTAAVAKKPALSRYTLGPNTVMSPLTAGGQWKPGLGENSGTAHDLPKMAAIVKSITCALWMIIDTAPAPPPTTTSQHK